MESTSGQPHSNLKNQLFEQSRNFSFNQAYRLIHLLLKEKLGDKYSDEEILQQIRIRPELSLDFPNSDITQIKETIYGGKSGCQITATFLGLYGSSSPLPTFYTEDLFRDDYEGNPLVREFIDIFNNHMYQLFFKIWSTHRLSYQLFEAKNPQYLSYLYNLGGFGNETTKQIIPNQYNILRYIGLMGHLPRSALGLTTLLVDLLEIKSIEIIQCRNTVISIPLEQQFSLGIRGNILGDTTHLGSMLTTANEAFTIKIGPIGYLEYKSLIPGRKKFQLLYHTVHAYIDQPLTWDLELNVIGEELSSTGLGTKQWAQLGQDTWLFANGVTKSKVYSVNFN